MCKQLETSFDAANEINKTKISKALGVDQGLNVASLNSDVNLDTSDVTDYIRICEVANKVTTKIYEHRIQQRRNQVRKANLLGKYRISHPPNKNNLYKYRKF